MAATEIKVFYSWQSDLPNSTTRGLIQSSIDAAVKGLRNTVAIEADRDTKGIYGSPDIVQTIFSKIDDCDIFVADVSGVATYHPLDGEGKPTKRLKMTPNPNVLLELGYAIQVVGWENIICIMNEDYSGDGEIPFDIEHHRLTRYSLQGREKAEVRKELRDVIASTVMNVIENGKRTRLQFSNIALGTWIQDKKTVSKSLIPYNVYEAGPAQNMLDTLLDSARILIAEIQEAEVTRNDDIPDIEEVNSDAADVQKEKIITPNGVELTPVEPKFQLNFDKWYPVQIREEEMNDIRENIKTYLGLNVDEKFFEFGSLKHKISIIPGDAGKYDGTDSEQKKYYNYVELGSIIAEIQMLEFYRKTFDGLLLFPLAAKNESSVSDSDIHISIQIDTSTAEIVYPTSELICKNLRGIEGLVYEKGLVELVLAQNETVDIKNDRDDRFWSIEDQQNDIQAMFCGGINGTPRYTSDDYAKELSRYVAEPEAGSYSDFSFYISSLHAKESKWLSRLIILKPLKDKIQIKYSIKSSNSDGSLGGNLELMS